MGGPNFRAVTQNVRSKTRGQVTGGVHDITSVPTERAANAVKNEENDNGSQVTSRKIVGVVNGKDTDNKRTSGNDFREESTNGHHKFLRICSKGACSGIGTNDLSYTVTDAEVDGRKKVSISNE